MDGQGYQNQMHVSMYTNSFRDDRMDFLESGFHTVNQGYEFNKTNVNNPYINYHNNCLSANIEQPASGINEIPNANAGEDSVSEPCPKTVQSFQDENQIITVTENANSTSVMLTENANSTTVTENANSTTVTENANSTSVTATENTNAQPVETCPNNNYQTPVTETADDRTSIPEKSPDDELRELLGDENETLSVPFTLFEIKKLAKQKLKKAGNKTRLQKRQIKINLVRKIQEEDYRKLFRIKWKVKKLYKELKEKNPDYELPNAPSKKNKTNTENEPVIAENDFNVIKGLKSKKEKYTEWRRKRMSDPKYREMIRAKDNAQRRKKRQIERQKTQTRDNAKRKERLKDPEYRAMTRARDNATRKFRRQMANKQSKLSQIRQTETRARRRDEDPEYKAFLTNQDAASRKVRRQDPAYRQAERLRDNASRRNRRKDPQYRKKESERQKNNQQDKLEKARSKAVENIQKFLDTNLGTFKGPPEMVLETLENKNGTKVDDVNQPSTATLSNERKSEKTLEEEYEEIYEVQTI